MGKGIAIDHLMNIHKRSRLIESPIFVRLRRQMLEVDSGYHPSLLKAFMTCPSRRAAVHTLSRTGSRPSRHASSIAAARTATTPRTA